MKNKSTSDHVDRSYFDTNVDDANVDNDNDNANTSNNAKSITTTKVPFYDTKSKSYDNQHDYERNQSNNKNELVIVSDIDYNPIEKGIQHNGITNYYNNVRDDNNKRVSVPGTIENTSLTSLETTIKKETPSTRNSATTTITNVRHSKDELVLFKDQVQRRLPATTAAASMDLLTNSDAIPIPINENRITSNNNAFDHVSISSTFHNTTSIALMSPSQENNMNTNNTNNESGNYVEAVPVQSMILVSAEIMTPTTARNSTEGTRENANSGSSSDNNIETQNNNEVSKTRFKMPKQYRTTIFISILSSLVVIIISVIVVSINLKKNKTDALQSSDVVPSQQPQDKVSNHPTISPTVFDTIQPTVTRFVFTTPSELSRTVSTYLNERQFNLQQDNNVSTIFNTIEDWDVSAITDFAGLFASYMNSAAFTFNADLSRWNMSSAINVTGMFYGANEFTSDLSKWDVSNVQLFSYMFSGATNFTSNLSQWNVSSAIAMDYMFQSTESFTSDLSQWDVSKVTNMMGMFQYANVFQSDLSKWDVSSVTDLSAMFSGAINFESDLSQWNTSNVIALREFVCQTKYFQTNFSLWDTSRVTDMRQIFALLGSNNPSIGIENWDVRNVQYMDYAFYMNEFFDGNLSNWDTSNVISTSYMFAETNRFRGIGLEHWDTSKVSMASHMFDEAVAFNRNLSKWDVSKLSDLSYMFSGTTQFEGQGLETWSISTSSFVNFAFCNATAFNRSYISNWNLSWSDLSC